MKKFLKILGKSILWIILGILVILGIFLIIIGTKGLNYCYNYNYDSNSGKNCYELKLNLKNKQYYNGINNDYIFTGMWNFNYLNGARNGQQNYYYENGNIGIICYYEDGILNGEFKGYYKNGQIMGIINHKNGKENGKYITYHENGNILEEGNYNNGKKNGIWTGYYEDGNIKYIYNYNDGEFIYNNENYDISDLEKEDFITNLMNEIYSK